MLKNKRERKLARKQQRWKEKKHIYQLVKNSASDIMASENFRSTRNHIQHGNIHVHRHCMDVAEQSIKISRFLRVPCNEKEMIRGALLHDYFLYDWHDRTRADYQKWHGFYHPGIALQNAGREYCLTDREKDIIKKHMWPLTVVPPLCREAWIVTAADKYCSLLETLKIRRRLTSDRNKE